MKSDITSDRPFSGGGRRLVPGTAQELAGAMAMRSLIASFVTFHTMRYSIFVQELPPEADRVRSELKLKPLNEKPRREIR